MSAKDRQITVYPSQKYSDLVTGYALAFEMSESRAAKEALELFFNKMPEMERARLMAIAKQNRAKNSY